MNSIDYMYVLSFKGTLSQVFNLSNLGANHLIFTS